MILTEREKKMATAKPKPARDWITSLGKGKGYTTRKMADGSLAYKVCFRKKYIGTYYTESEAAAKYNELVQEAKIEANR